MATAKRTNKVQGGLADLIDAMGARHNARAKADADLKTAILKMKAASMIRMQEAQAKTRMAQNTPEQKYLRRRAMEENPLAQMSIPEEGNDTDQVEFPGEMPPTQNKQGVYERGKTPNEDQKNQFYLAKLEKMIEAAKRGEGKMPSALAIKIGERMRERMNRKLGYAKDKEDKPLSQYKPNKPTQGFLAEVSDLMGSGKIKTQADAMAHLEKVRPRLEMTGGNIPYIESKIKTVLPKTAQPSSKGGLMDNLQRIGNALYKKVTDGWQLQKEEEPDLVDEEYDED